MHQNSSVMLPIYTQLVTLLQIGRGTIRKNDCFTTSQNSLCIKVPASANMYGFIQKGLVLVALFILLNLMAKMSGTHLKCKKVLFVIMSFAQLHCKCV